MTVFSFRTSLFIGLFILFSTSIVAQNKVFKLFTEEKAITPALKNYVTKGSTYAINEPILEELLQSKPGTLELEFNFENKVWLIELKKSELFSKGFFVQTADNKSFDYKTGETLHYKGNIKGKPKTFAAISILHNEVIAVLADEKGNINIGAINKEQTSVLKEHIIFRESDLVLKQPFDCGADKLPADIQNPLPQFAAPVINSAVINTEPVDVYFETDYRCFQNNGSSVINTVNWAVALFNVVTTLYENDSVYTRMSAIKVWNIADPYVLLSTTSTVLSAFSTDMSEGFHGDLAHLLSQRSLGGGIAWLNVLCSSAFRRTGVSANLSNSFSSLPSYSWSTMVITHELGHNIASNHTQWCGWPGGAIDNCYSTEGSCPPGPAPVNGGTIMSYCHLNVGINLANGFGPLPGAAIRNAVRNNTCIYPRITFLPGYETVTEETADIDNNCLDYQLFNVKLAVNYTPTQPAIISLTPSVYGTPGLEIGANKDVELLTTDLILSDTTPQIIQLKIYDDAQIENRESLKLDYTLAANGTNAVKYGTYQLDILSLDHKPDSTINRLLFYEPFDGINSGLGSWTQTVIYGAASPNRWVIGNTTDTTFSTRAAYVSNNGTSEGYAGNSINDSSVIRLVSPLINASGFSGLRLSYQFKCNGEGPGQGPIGGGNIPLDFGRIYISVDNGGSWVLIKDNIYGRNYKYNEETGLPPEVNNSPGLRLAFEWTNNRSVVNNPPFILDSIVIMGTGSSSVQTLAHAANSNTAWLGPYQTIHYYNPVTQNIMATITNKSNHDFGCTTVDIVRTGDSAVTAWGDYAAQKITNKSYRVTAANNNPNAPYDISLYYTEKEINSWANITGNNANDIAIVKTTADITQAPPVSPPEFSNYNTINNYGNANDKVITATFTGLSNFSIGKAGIVPICPASIQQLSANETGLYYLWEVDNGSGYTDVSDGAIYNGAYTQNLTLTNAPTSWYGNKYRCIIGDAEGAHYSIEYLLKFALNWKGTVSNTWSNISNWGCTFVPDANTDVFIKPVTTVYPTIKTNTSIRSLTIQNGASVTVQTGKKLTIVH